MDLHLPFLRSCTAMDGIFYRYFSFFWPFPVERRADLRLPALETSKSVLLVNQKMTTSVLHMTSRRHEVKQSHPRSCPLRKYRMTRLASVGTKIIAIVPKRDFDIIPLQFSTSHSATFAAVAFKLLNATGTKRTRILSCSLKNDFLGE